MCLRGPACRRLDRSYPYVLQIRHATPGNRAEQTAEPAKLLLNKGYLDFPPLAGHLR
jgi:hypothetical protein